VDPLGENIDWVEMDVCNDESVDQAITQVLAACGSLDALVCNAGFGIFGSIEEVSMEAYQRQLDTNLGGTLRVLKRVLPGMREARSGRIALVGSIAGRATIPFQAHYSASKAAVESIAGGLYNEVRPFGIEVALIEPGDINTPFNAAMEWDEGSDSHYAERIRSCERVILESLPKAPGPEVVADAIVKALTSKRPRFRYTVGPDSIIMPLGKRLLPDWLVLRFIRDHFKI
jgi:NAD(P)-dependent dehydrogenase (short-subunit alcohol dehydrogenase family)